MSIHYVTKDDVGITRTRTGKSYIYAYKGKRIKDPATLQRIKQLKIPPGYKNVWICKNKNGHIQAYGYDEKNRKQYIYHAKWVATQAKKKFSHLHAFGKKLPKIRKSIIKNLQLKSLKKEKVIAAVLKLLDTTSIRIGSPQYDSYGLLTIRKKHLHIKKATIYLDFEGKSKQRWHLEVYNKTLADFLRRCENLPGYKLFKYFDSNKKLHTLTVKDVNDYLQKLTAEHVTAKEFRIWKANVLYLHCMQKYQDSLSDVAQRICIEKVAKELNNTPRICRNSYIHPLLLKSKLKQTAPKKIAGLTELESQLINLIK